jgi:hypothetical protein
VLAHHANDQGRCWPGLGLLAIEMNLQRRQVINLVQELVSLGELAIEKRGRGRGHATRYRLLVTGEKVQRAAPIADAEKVQPSAVKGALQRQEKVQSVAHERLERSEPAPSTSPRPVRGATSGRPRPLNPEILQRLRTAEPEALAPDSAEPAPHTHRFPSTPPS